MRIRVGTWASGENEMAYEDIAVPVPNFPASAGMFGNKVRDAILDLDQRVAIIESVTANYALKPSDQSKPSLTTPSADADLFLPLEANSKYFVEIFGVVSGLSAADILTNWALPSGASGTRRCSGPGSTVADEANANGVAGRFNVNSAGTNVGYNLVRNGVGQQMWINEFGTITTGATAGQITFQWSQTVSNATGTVVHANSFMRATLIG
jgi:hypothetical protein